MPDMTTYGKQQILADGFGVLNVATLYLALFSTTADPTKTTTELSLTNYVRQPVTFYAYSADTMANSTDIIFPNLSAGSFLGAQIRDVISGGSCWCWVDQANPITIPGPATDLTFAAGTLTVTRT